VEVVSHGVSLGPDISNTFLLDTGAQGIMAVGYAVIELEYAGYQTVAIYDEIGVGGATPYHVSDEYDFRFAGTDGVPIITLPDARILSNKNGNFGGFGGIVGMPGMVNRVTELDLAAMKSGIWGWDLMHVYFHDQLPAGNGHRYTTALNLVEFPPSGQRNETDPLPTYADLPFFSARLQNGAFRSTGEFLLDTGAQVSILSTETAIALGLDLNGNGLIDTDPSQGEAVATIEIMGVGGIMEVPIVAIDRLAIPTDQGPELVFTDLNWIVLDIDTEPGQPEINGIFGSDLLVSGWTMAILDPFGETEYGYFMQVYFDFRDAANHNGTLVFDVNPSLDRVLLAGDFNRDGYVDLADYTVWADHFGQAAAPGELPADGNADGYIDLADYTVWADNFGRSAP
jgi:hypothetical protein